MNATIARFSTNSKTRSSLSSPRFFIEGVRQPGDIVAITGGDAHKISHVLRLRDGDEIEVVDSGARVFDARVVLENGVFARLESMRQWASSAPRVDVSLAQAVPKAQKMDFIVEKCTELGAAQFLPFTSERTVAHATQQKVERWRRLARIASMQCGRSTIPVVRDPATFDEVLTSFSSFDVVLFPWELAPHEPPRRTLETHLAGAARVLIVIGPEGGFSHAEAQRARDCGAHALWLGPRILRTETAGMVTMAFVNLLADG